MRWNHCKVNHSFYIFSSLLHLKKEILIAIIWILAGSIKTYDISKLQFIKKLPTWLNVQRVTLKKPNEPSSSPAILRQPIKVPGEKKLSKRCQFCPRLRDRKTTIKCTICNGAACSEHSISYVLCEKCQEKYNEDNDSISKSVNL